MEIENLITDVVPDENSKVGSIVLTIILTVIAWNFYQDNYRGD
jgi:hypothetical protein